VRALSEQFVGEDNRYTIPGLRHPSTPRSSTRPAATAFRDLKNITGTDYATRGFGGVLRDPGGRSRAWRGWSCASGRGRTRRPWPRALQPAPAQAADPRRLGARGGGLAFQPETGYAVLAGLRERRGFDPRRKCAATPTSTSSAPFQDEWLRGGPVRRWVPRGYADRPVYIFETGGSTGVPKVPHQRRGLPHRLLDVQRDAARRVLPQGRGLAAPRPLRPPPLRLAVEHLCQVRGGICFMVDLDPRWVIKLVKAGDMATMESTSSTSSTRA
jgi:hypothetical protein